MENLQEYSKEVVDRFIRSMGYDPKHIDRDKRMAFTKTIRFQQYAQRMGEGFDVQRDTVLEGDSRISEVIKTLYRGKRNKLGEELYDHEKDEKGGKDSQPQAAAVLKGGKTMTGQTRDTVEIDPVMKKNKPAAQNTTDDNT